MSKSPRMHWLDGARLSAAFCIIALHASADHHGQAFDAATAEQRIFAVLMRTVSEIASTEFFLLLSIFLFAARMQHRSLPYLNNIKQQARRLLIPFLVWTVFYAFFRLYKAHYFGYSDSIWAELTRWQSWVFYLTLGNSNYHMHFLPTLFSLMLFYPIFRFSIKAPVLALTVVPLIYFNSVLGDFIWRTFDDILLIESWMRAAKILTYTGYGFVAYALYGYWLSGCNKKSSEILFKFAVLILIMGFLTKLTYSAEVIASGNFGIRRGKDYMVHFLFPCLLIMAFMASHYMHWPKTLSQWSKYAFGMYLLHPAFLYLLEVAVYNWQLTPTQLVLSKFIFAAVMSLCTSVAISRIPWLAWTIGLGMIPLIEKPKARHSRVTVNPT